MDRICRSLAKAGHAVTLVGRAKPNSLPLGDKPYQQKRISLRFQRGKLFYLEYNWKLYRWLRTQPVDVINSIDLDTLLAGYFAKQKEQQLVFDAHEYFSETPELIDRPFIQGIWRKLAHWLIPKADLCYTVGPALARIFTRQYGTEFGVVRNLPRAKVGADTPRNQPSADKKTKIILYQGMLNQGRGLAAAIDAMAFLPADYHLWLVGNGDLTDVLKQRSQASGQQDRIHFKGFIEMDALPAITAQADLGLNLLDAVSPSYYYSLANKCFDYLQAGLPSIQMNFPEYRALQEQYKCFVLLPELNAKKLAVKIEATLADPIALAKLQANCQRAAKELSWEREEVKLLSLWEAIG